MNFIVQQGTYRDQSTSTVDAASFAELTASDGSPVTEIVAVTSLNYFL